MISKEEVQHIAKLARIKLTDDELEKYRVDFAQILDYFNMLSEVETKDVQPMTHSVQKESIAREDIPKREQPDIIYRMMQLIPVIKDGFLQVKEILKHNT